MLSVLTVPRLPDLSFLCCVEKTGTSPGYKANNRYQLNSFLRGLDFDLVLSCPWTVHVPIVTQLAVTKFRGVHCYRVALYFLSEVSVLGQLFAVWRVCVIISDNVVYDKLPFFLSLFVLSDFAHF
jgi:hypothetical protein